MGGCRGVAGKPAAVRRLEMLNTARNSSEPSTATFRRPHPRVPLHVTWGYMHRQGTPRRVGGRIAGPAAPPPPRSGRRGKSTQRSRARGVGGRHGVGIAGEAAAVAYSLPVPFRRPPRSARAMVERADHKYRLQALFY